MNIALDVMGGDLGPGEMIAGAVEAARTEKITISLVGQPNVIEAELAKYDVNGLDLPIVPASQVIHMDDSPAKAVRAKTDSSIVVASQMVRRGEAQGFVTAGNTGAAMAAGILQIGRTKGILRPALLTPFPTVRGFCVVLDVGANPDVRPEHLQQFAIMGSIYARNIMSVEEPTVSLLSIGEEAGKGNQLVLSAYSLLDKTPGINFQGNAESNHIMDGQVDVVVSDGFTGNIFLKTTEAAASKLSQIVLEELTSGPISRAGAFLAQAGLRRVRQRIDYRQYGGAALLGLSGLVVVAHGRSSAIAIQNAIGFAKQGIEQNILEEIQEGVQQASSATSEASDEGNLNMVPT